LIGFTLIFFSTPAYAAEAAAALKCRRSTRRTEMNPTLVIIALIFGAVAFAPLWRCY
jgi:hypothetical protein